MFGESGSGKELAARAIHRYSRRAKGPFVAVNMAALSPSLAESELFGHERGAFTGAENARKGLLEQAHCGTIFLDEVADIPPALQVKLLRALEHGEILPVGGESPVTSDFRLISATHQNLRRLVSEGKIPARSVFPADHVRDRNSPAPPAARRHPRVDRVIFSICSRRKTASPARAFRRKRWPNLPAARGTETCASCATPWNMR